MCRCIDPEGDLPDVLVTKTREMAVSVKVKLVTRAASVTALPIRTILKLLLGTKVLHRANRVHIAWGEGRSLRAMVDWRQRFPRSYKASRLPRRRRFARRGSRARTLSRCPPLHSTASIARRSPSILKGHAMGTQPSTGDGISALHSRQLDRYIARKVSLLWLPKRSYNGGGEE